MVSVAHGIVWLMSFTVLDGIVLVVTLVSAVLAMVRGFVREVLSIASWVVAAIAAYAFYDDLLPLVSKYIHHPQLALAASIGGVFLVTLIVVSIITMKISDFVIDSRIGFVDRALGFVFGAARGILLLVVAMLFFNWLVPQDRQPPWVADARTKTMLDQLGGRLVAALPSNPDAIIAERLGPGLSGKIPGLKTDTTTAPAAPGAPGTQPAPQTPDASYGTGSRQSLDQLIQSTNDGSDTSQTQAPAASGGQPQPATPPAGTQPAPAGQGQ